MTVQLATALPSRGSRSGAQASRQRGSLLMTPEQNLHQLCVWMFNKFIPQPSLKSMGA